MNKMYISWEVKVSYLMNDCINLLEESDVQNWCFQVFSCMPQRGYFHRDLKSENMFSKNVIIKITDLGVAHSNIQSMSRHAGTWHQTYRLQSYVYTSKVDMWATGAILTKICDRYPNQRDMVEGAKSY
uniref:Protein kinase domain-containing protein n=1 Tax=Brassica oleracea var. oleracea TaxID=109376 RepID=A0A0D3D8D0_BRAOL